MAGAVHNHVNNIIMLDSRSLNAQAMLFYDVISIIMYFWWYIIIINPTNWSEEYTDGIVQMVKS